MSENAGNVVNEETRGRNTVPKDGARKSQRDPSKSRDVATMEAKVVKVELAMADVLERLDRLEQSVDDDSQKDDSPIADISSTVESHIQEASAFQARMLEALQSLQAQVEGLRKEMDENKADVTLCKRAMSNGGPTQVLHAMPKIEIPKPKEFKGKRDAKELENYLWHMERYFDAINIEERRKVSTASLYLTDLAAIWWRRKYAEIEKGTCTINTWDDLKQELKKQFYP